MSALTDRLPEWLKSMVISVDTLTVEGQQFQYVIIRQPPEAAPALCTGYVACNRGAYFVSADIPAEYREHVLRHEMYEFGILQNCAGACRRAFHYELAHVQLQDFQGSSYIFWRRDVLGQLYTWMRLHPAEYTRTQCNDIQYGIELMSFCLKSKG